MWICVKDRSGKYIINMSDFEEIRCRKFESEDYYSLVFYRKNSVFSFELKYDNYEDVSSAYDYVKKQLCKEVEE